LDVSIWVVILLVLLSGAVAAVGDWLGRRLGKKRLRFGRLRPKHTAIITTFIAGMLITAVTIVILSLMSEPVRKWLTEGARIQEQLSEARGDLSAAQTQLDAGRKDIAGVRAELQTEREKLAEEQKKVDSATKEAETMRKEAASLKTQVALLGGKIEASAKKLSDLQARYDEVDTELKIRLDNIAEYKRQQDEYIEQNNQLLASNATLEGDISRLQKRITDLNKEVEDAQQAQAIANASFVTERQRIEADRQKALADLRSAESELTNARKLLSDVQRAAAMFRSDASRARFNKLIYSRGDELARLPVRSMLSQAEARNYLLAVMELASRDALARGAEELQNSNIAVGFLAFTMNDGTVVTQEMQFQQAVDEIAAKPTDQLIVVRTLTNAFEDDSIAIDVETVPNRIVYSLGDFIIETRIDGRMGVQGVTEALVTFIADQLRERAVKDGMVPATGRQPELGEITQEQIQQIVGDIVVTERTIVVRFHAAKETRAGDTLTLDIRLR
jgi:uncharacterized protein (DUF3084 family)